MTVKTTERDGPMDVARKSIEVNVGLVSSVRKLPSRHCYYEDDDGNFIYACQDNDIFRIGMSALSAALPLGDSAAWSFLVPGSLPYDAAWKRIGTHRVTTLDAQAIAALPAVPLVPDYTPVSRTDAFKPEAPLLGTAYPWVGAALQRVAVVDLYLVLYEDDYETSFGDGVYRYLHAVFLSGGEADRCRAIGLRGSTLHRRTVSLALQGEQIVFVRASRQRDDHWRCEQVLTALNQKLSPPAMDDR